MEHRIKFYSKEDMGTGFYLKQVEEVLDKFLENPDLVPNSAVDAIEFNNVVKYIENEVFSIYWSEQYIIDIKKIIIVMRKTISKYFGTLSEIEILESMKELEYIYYDDFFDFFSRFKYGSKISAIKFEEAFNDSNIPLRFIMKTSYFIEKYPIFLKNSFLSNSLNLELLPECHSDNSNDKLKFPDNITKEEWNILVQEYIENPSSNMNYLKMLENPIKTLDNSKYFTISAKQKIAIKELQKDFIQSMDVENSGLLANSIVYTNRERYEKDINKAEVEKEMSPKEAVERSILKNIMVSMGESQPQQYSFTLRGLVDKEYLTKFHEFFNIFKYVSEELDFFSKKGISKLPSFPNKEIRVISSRTIMQTVNSYTYDIVFNVKQKLAMQKIMVISKILSEWNIRLEEVIEWYFNVYCKDEYNLLWLPFDIPHPEEKIGNKTATLFRIEEFIRKQYSILIEEKNIDSALVNEIQTPTIEQIGSWKEKKYVYLSDKKTPKTILHLLFSNQSRINYIDNELNEENFYKLITSNNVKISNFHEHQKPTLDFLVEKKIIEEKDDRLDFVNQLKIELLKEIFLFEESSFLRATDIEKKYLIELAEEEMIVFGSSLFSRQESRYLNFLLNNKNFDNGWAIRNAYQHGVPYYEEEGRYLEDNYIVLIVLIHMIVKIDDELYNFHSK